MRRHRPPTAAVRLTVATAALAWVPPALAANSFVTVPAAPAGVTPRFLGFNNGHYRATSDTSAWVEYSGINAMRVWAAANEYVSTAEGPTYGDGVTTRSQFDADRAAVRASPESNPFLDIAGINWSKTLTGRNHINVDYVLSQLQQKGIDVLLQTTRSTAYNYVGSGPDGNIWGGRWEQWKWYYTVAYWAARNYDVQRYQMYNEPDLAGIGRSEWVDRMKVASDAVHAAIADVNARYGKRLAVDVYAPVAASTTGSLDTWGKAALATNRTDFEGNPSPYDLFNVYDVHRYNSTGPTFANDQVLFDSKIPAYNQSGRNLPVTYSEFNRQNTSSFSASPNSLDTPGVYADLASILVGAMSQDVHGMYAFKFNQTYWTNSSGVEEPMKTGFYYVDDSATAHSTDTHDTTGATQGAEVMRLADKAFKGQRPRYAVVTGNASNDAAGSFDADARRYYYYSVNRATSAAAVTLDLSNWDVAPGETVTVEEVSADHHGDVSRAYTVPANGTLTFSQSPQSLFLLTIPSGAARATVDVPAAADASVSHAAPSLNAGLLPAAYAGRSDTTDADDATYLKFSLASTPLPNVSRAVLWLTGRNVAGSALTTLHLYGLYDDAWTEAGITWDNAPDLAGASDAELANVGADAFPLGQLTYDATSSQYGVDVTDFVRRHPDSALSFALLRERRFAGDSDASRIQFNTRESLAGQPRLSLSLYSNPVYNWRANADGDLGAPANLDVHAAPDAPGAVLNLGGFITAPHTVSVTAPATLGSLRFNNLNAYTLAGPATLTLATADGSAPSIAVTQGSHTIRAPLAFSSPATLTLSPGTQLDITTNTLLLAAANGSSPASTIRQYLHGAQLISSTAGADPQHLHALGYLLDPTTNTITVKTTLLGDANLDAVLNADDYALLDRGFAKHLSTWQAGDFNYDGAVDANDYLLIDSTYARSHALAPAFLARRESQFGSAYVSTLLASVPEPSLFTCLLAAPLLRRRRHA